MYMKVQEVLDAYESEGEHELISNPKQNKS
jgi:hypothetical protein